MHPLPRNSVWRGVEGGLSVNHYLLVEGAGASDRLFFLRPAEGRFHFAFYSRTILLGSTKWWCDGRSGLGGTKRQIESAPDQGLVVDAADAAAELGCGGVLAGIAQDHENATIGGEIAEAAEQEPPDRASFISNGLRGYGNRPACFAAYSYGRCRPA